MTTVDKDIFDSEIKSLLEIINNYKLEINDEDKINDPIKAKLYNGIINQLKNQKEDSEYINELLDELNIKEEPNSCSFQVLVLIVAPAFLLIISVILGSILSLVENWQFWDGFVQIATNMTGSAYHQTSNSPSQIAGVLFDVFIGLQVVIIQVIVGTFISISGFLNLSQLSQSGNCFGIVIIFVITPIVLSIVGLLSSVMMWWLEPNMTFQDSFGFSFSNLCALANTLTSEQPETTIGIVLSQVVSSYTQCLIGIIFAIIGNIPMFNYAMSQWELIFKLRSNNQERQVGNKIIV